MNSFIAFIANIYFLLFAPIGDYIVTSTTLDADGETWTDTQTRMTQGQLNKWFAKVRPDLANEYACKSLELKPGEMKGLGTGNYESLFIIERV